MYNCTWISSVCLHIKPISVMQTMGLFWRQVCVYSKRFVYYTRDSPNKSSRWINSSRNHYHLAVNKCLRVESLRWSRRREGIKNRSNNRKKFQSNARVVNLEGSQTILSLLERGRWPGLVYVLSWESVCSGDYTPLLPITYVMKRIQSKVYSTK